MLKWLKLEIVTCLQDVRGARRHSIAGLRRFAKPFGACVALTGESGWDWRCEERIHK